MNKHTSTLALCWKSAVLALMAVLAVGTQEVQAQCTTASCPDQVVPRNPSAPYQMDARTKVRKVLLYDNAPGHGAGKQALRRALYALSNKYGFELTINDDAIGWINPSRLQDVDVVVFSQGDCDVASTPTSDSALQNYIYRDGGSMLMVHAAAAFISCPGTGTGSTCGTGGHDIAASSCRFMARAAARQYYHHQNAGSAARIYVDSVFAGQVPPHMTCTGGSGTNCSGTAPHTAVPPVAAMNHGKRNDETKNMFNNAIQWNFPLPPNSSTDPNTHVWNNFADEWYEYYNNPGPRAIPQMFRQWNGNTYIEDRLNILLSMDETSRYLGSQRMGDHPQSWVRKMGRGLAAYNNIGHDATPYGGTSGTTARSGTAAFDSLPHAYMWNLIRFLARDYVGCMVSTNSKYVPWASVETLTPGDVSECEVVSIADAGTKAASGISTLKNGVIRVATPVEGFYRVLVSDMQGRQMYAKTVIGGQNKNVDVPQLTKGTYTVQVTSPSKSVDVLKVNL